MRIQKIEARSPFWIEPVADPRFGDEKPGVRGVRFQLLAELPHEHAQILWLFLRSLTPNGLQQRGMRDHPVGMPRHVDEQIELLRRQAYFMAVRMNAARGEVDPELSSLERFLSRRGGTRPPQGRAHPRHQLV